MKKNAISLSILLFGVLTAGAVLAPLTVVAQTGSSSQGAASAALWQPIITSSMQYIRKRTKMPLLAPVTLGTSSDPYLTAMASATSTTFRVELHRTSSPLPLNSPAISQPPNNGLAQLLGDFGGRQYQTKNEASSALLKSAGYFEQTKGTPRAIYLGYGITGKVYNTPYEGIVTWNERKWAFQVNGGEASSDIRLAETIIAQLQRAALPGSSGKMSVENAGDGQHTALSWQSGTVVYFSSDYHLATNALLMAESMRPYASPLSGGFPTTITQAMQTVRGQTVIPLRAPKELGLTQSEAAAIWEQATASYGHYSVKLIDSNAENGTTPIASFGGQGYAQKPTALVYAQDMIAGAKLTDVPASKISLGNGVTGNLYSAAGLLRWSEGRWTFDVAAGSADTNVQLGARIVNYLQTHTLPETTGYMRVAAASGGTSTRLYWVSNDVLYHVYSATSVIQALQMATSFASF